MLLVQPALSSPSKKFIMHAYKHQFCSKLVVRNGLNFFSWNQKSDYT